MEENRHSPVQNSLQLSNSFSSLDLKRSVSPGVALYAEPHLDSPPPGKDNCSEQAPGTSPRSMYVSECKSPFGSLSSFARSVSDASRELHGKALSREKEAKRLAQLLNLTERGKLSQNFTRWLLKTDAIAARHSYDIIIRHLGKRKLGSRNGSDTCARKNTPPQVERMILRRTARGRCVGSL